MGVLVPRCGFFFRHDRFYVIAEARPDGGQAISAFGIIWQRQSPAAGYERGWASPLRPRYCGIKGFARSRQALSVPTPYLNNIIEQDHRFIKKRINVGLGFRSPEGAWRTIEGYEGMPMIRKGQVRWLDKGDVIGQRQFIHNL